jgi:clan AA aspartic protease
MILGVVSASLEARVPLFLEDVSGQTHRLEAVLDTGFSGFLSLSPALISMLGWTWLRFVRMILGDGTEQTFHVFNASIIWDGQSRLVRAYAIDGEPLIGMKLLAGHDVHIRVNDGGLVRIDTIP